MDSITGEKDTNENVEEPKKTRKYVKKITGDDDLEAPKVKKEKKPLSQERIEQNAKNLEKGRAAMKIIKEQQRIDADKRKEVLLLKRAEQLKKRDEQYLKSLGYVSEEEDSTTVETNSSIAPDTKIIKMKKPKKKTIIYKEESDSGSEEEVIIRRRPKKEKKIEPVIEKEKPPVEKPVNKPIPRIIFA
jgi:hypothetical protein